MPSFPSSAALCVLLSAGYWTAAADRYPDAAGTELASAYPHDHLSADLSAATSAFRPLIAQDAAAALRGGQGPLVPERLALLDADGFQNPSTTLTKTSSTGFLDELKSALGAFVAGLVLLVLSVPVLWFNEQRAAQNESLLSYGKASVIACTGEKAAAANRGRLVYLKGEQMRARAPVQDGLFPKASMKEGCIRLSRKVELYQYIEQSTTEEKEKWGGGKEKVTTYTYTEGWSDSFHGSNQEPKYKNENPGNLDLGSTTTNCTHVEYGAGYILGDGLVHQCSSFQSVTKEHFGEELTSAGKTFAMNLTDNRYYLGGQGGKKRGPSLIASKPEVGDARVTFEYVPDGPATVLALQVGAALLPPKDGGGAAIEGETFGPYRLISRGLCGVSDEQETERLIEQSKKGFDELAQENMCTCGPLACLCCICNLVAGCCAGVLTNELYHIFTAPVELEKCFSNIAFNNTLKKWGFRVGGWVVMFAGLYMLFAPFLAILAIIPFFKTIGAMAIWVFCFIVTAAVASLIICLAYLAYHPIKALMGAAVVSLLVALPFVVPMVTGKA